MSFCRVFWQPFKHFMVYIQLTTQLCSNVHYLALLCKWANYDSVYYSAAGHFHDVIVSFISSGSSTCPEVEP